MWALICFLLQLLLVYLGFRRQPQGGMKFVVILVFALSELAIFIAPVSFMNTESRYFPVIYMAICTVGLLNIVGFIVVLRRWMLPDGRIDPGHRGARNP